MIAILCEYIYRFCSGIHNSERDGEQKFIKNKAGTEI